MATYDDASRRLIAGRLAAFTRLLHKPDDGLKRAAVAIALIEAGATDKSLSFLLTRRVGKLRSHAGQWALPGGRCDLNESFLQAALREMREEVGLDVVEGDVLGVLDDYPTRSGYLISPVVVWCRPGHEPHANPDEVRAIHRIPVADLMPDDVVTFVRIPESERPVIKLKMLGQHIHAPTAALLYQFREVLAGRNTRVADLEQPVFAWR